MSPDNSYDLMRAVDAAIVRSHHAGDILTAMNRAPPFQAVEAHNCRSDDPALVPFPPAETATGLLRDVLDTRRLKILALGQDNERPDWNDDGNYQVDPPTGFWPTYMNLFMDHFRAEYGDIALERVWVSPSADTRRVINGDVHMTEPYYVAENLYDGTGEMKKWSHRFGCIVMAYDKTFFVKTETVSITDADDPECAANLTTCINNRIGQQISSKAVLNTRIDAATTETGRSIGFLSMGNYNSISPLLSNNVVPRIFTSTEEIYTALEAREIIAGMISGQPDDRFHSFPTELVSPRAFQFSNSTDAVDLIRAVDAAVVRGHNAGDILTAMRASPPFEAVEVHNCRVDDVSTVPFPDENTATGYLRDVLTTRTLRMLALGNTTHLPNWHQDGNYQVTPMTGFWPTYMNLFMGHFREAYGQDIQLERVWSKPSSNTAMIMDGTVHMTEPYYIGENLYDGTGQLKKWSHEFSCFVMGYEQQFFTTQVQTDFSSVGTSCTEQLNACQFGEVSDANYAGIPCSLSSAIGWLMGLVLLMRG
jgi:hypothetical protein